MESPGSPQITLALTRCAEQGEDAEHIAQRVLAAWQAIGSALAPVIGQRGVLALYKRSLHLASPGHPWLPQVADDAQVAIDLAPLHSALARQGSVEAAAGGSALLETFHALLESLIGLSLTERLLRSVWAHFFSNAITQKTPP